MSLPVVQHKSCTDNDKQPSFAETDQRQIIKTLRSVRIHITDPRPYISHLNEPLSKVLPKGTSVQNFLKRLDDSTWHLEEVQRKAITTVAMMR